MAEYHFPIPGHEDEKILFLARRHWASFLKSIFLILVLIFFPIAVLLVIYFMNRAIFAGNSFNIIVILVSIYYFVMTTYAFIEWISFYYDVIIITNDELIDIAQQGVFDRQIYEVAIIRIQDVSAHSKGFLQTFFGYGDVIAESAGEKTQTYVIEDIPNPVEVANIILNLHNERVKREERGMEITTAEGDLRKNRPEPTKEIVKEFVSQPHVEPPKVQETKEAEKNEEGDINKDQLNKGGEIKF